VRQVDEVEEQKEQHDKEEQEDKKEDEQEETLGVAFTYLFSSIFPKKDIYN
jgi:hypothetical protein